MKRKSIIKKVIIALVLITVIGSGAYWAMNQQGVEVRPHVVGKGEVQRLISESGSVESNESVQVGSTAQALVTQLGVKEGDFVEKGQFLLAYKQETPPKEPDATAEINSLKAKRKGLADQYAEAEDLAEKNKRLYEEGVISYEEYNKSESAVTQLESQVNSLDYSIQAAGLSKTAKTHIDNITAPISGTITKVSIKEGEVALLAEPLFEISNLENIVITVNLVSGDADEIAVGALARLYNENDLLLDENASVEKIGLTAQEIVSELGIVQKRVPVTIRPGEKSGLRLGSNVDVEIIVAKKENVLRVPENAIFDLNGKSYLYKIQGNKAVLTRVQPGMEGEEYTEILEGLKEGDQIVLSPSTELENGVRVKI